MPPPSPDPDAGAPMWFLFSPPAGVADAPCAQRGVTPATATPKTVTPAHLDIVVSLPKRRFPAFGRRRVCLTSSRVARSSRRCDLLTSGTSAALDRSAPAEIHTRDSPARQQPILDAPRSAGGEPP